MPNWCDNKLTITGFREDLDHFDCEIGNEFCFNKIIPMPEEKDYIYIQRPLYSHFV